jgi:SPP1 family predicted phage head-tail adaptor
MPINAGDLDRRLTIQAKTITRDSAGGAIETWTDETTVWAQKVDTTGREFRAAQATYPEVTYVFRIRYNRTLTTAHRLYFEGRYLDILQINEEGRRESQLVQARTQHNA